MIGVLVIAHAPLASALAAAAAHVYGCAPQRAQGGVRALDVAPDVDLAATVAAAQRLIEEIDTGDGVLVLVDAFGASPGNVAAQLARAGHVEVLAGVNLPMLLRALCYRDGTLTQTAEKALAGGGAGMLRVAPPAPSPARG
ncbi:MAG: PTS fructose transporter subunit IIA [Burkholderiaceae bacterium]|nr:PTS fructose transporter subunit IIA [Burkholderiaceae bacterium]